MKIQEQLQEKPGLASDKHGMRKRQQQLLVDLDLAPNGTGCRELPLHLLSPKFCGRHTKQSTSWFPFWRKGWKGFQTAAEVIQGKRKKQTNASRRRTSARNHARQAGWVQGMARRDVEKSSWNVNFLLYSSKVLLEAWTKRCRKSQTHSTYRQESGKPIKKKHWKDERQVKWSCQYNMRGKVWMIQTMRITIASQVQIDTPPHQHRRH